MVAGGVVISLRDNQQGLSNKTSLGPDMSEQCKLANLSGPQPPPP